MLSSKHGCTGWPEGGGQGAGGWSTGRSGRRGAGGWCTGSSGGVGGQRASVQVGEGGRGLVYR